MCIKYMNTLISNIPVINVTTMQGQIELNKNNNFSITWGKKEIFYLINFNNTHAWLDLPITLYMKIKLKICTIINL